MTARPDEVVAWLTVGSMGGVTMSHYDDAHLLPQGVHPLVRETIAINLAADLEEAQDTLEPFMELANERLHTIAELTTALQSANARLAESEAGRDEWMRGAESMHKRLAAVLALADELAREAAAHDNQYDTHRPAELNEWDEAMSEAKQDAADRIRRAAAGEGDANQGDGE